MSDKDIGLKNGGHVDDSAATPTLYIFDHTRDTFDAVDLIIRILPAFNLRSTEVVLVELFIGGNLRGRKLIEALSPDRQATFKLSNNYLRAGQRNEPDVDEACFHITHGTLMRQASKKPQSLTKIKGSIYKVLHTLTNQDLHEEDRRDNTDIAGRDEADDADRETSQDIFHEARSQFENVHTTSTTEETAEEEPAVAENLVATENESPIEDQHMLISSGTGQIASNANISTEDNLTRLDQAKRAIFKEDGQSIMEPVTASSPSPMIADTPSVHESDTEMLDDLASKTVTEPSENDTIKARQKKAMQSQSSGTIDGFLSSSKAAAHHGTNNHNIDPEDEAGSLVRNPKPLTLRRTSNAPSRSALQPEIPNNSAGNDKIREDTLTSKNDSDTEDDEPEPAAPPSKQQKDPAAEKASRAPWAASGARVNNELRKRLVDNDGKIGGDDPPKLWRGKHFGEDPDRRAANLRLRDIIKKQVNLHNLLVTTDDAGVAADLRRSLQRWDKGQVDEYERQLDAIFSAMDQTPSSDLLARNQQADSDSAEDSNDDLALPLMSSQQHKMANALLSEDQPVRKTTEGVLRGTTGSDQQTQPSTSPVMNNRGNDMPEDRDDDDLPDISDLLTPRLPRGSITKTQPARNTGESAERLKKKPRMD